MIFTQFPLSGDLAAANPANTASYNKERRAGVVAWNNIAEKMTSLLPGPGHVLPVGRLHPPAREVFRPGSRRRATRTRRTARGLRVRKLDNVHLCPEGSARYADALLADMTSVFHLAPADRNWSQGAWTSDPDFNDPPGACPDDHPPG